MPIRPFVSVRVRYGHQCKLTASIPPIPLNDLDILPHTHGLEEVIGGTSVANFKYTVIMHDHT